MAGELINIERLELYDQEIKEYISEKVLEFTGFPNGEPGAYTSDGTFSNLEYSWEQMVANGSGNGSYARPYVNLTYGVLEAQGYDVIVPTAVPNVGDFYAKNIILPETTTHVNGSDYSEFEKIYIKATTPPILNESAFSEMFYNSPEADLTKFAIIVPIGCGDAYKNAANWSAYADYISEIADSSITYSITVNTSGKDSGTYLSGSDNSSQKILNLYDITTTSSESTTTNGRNTAIGNDIRYTQVFGTGHTINDGARWSMIRGQGHIVRNHTTTDEENGSVVTIDGSTHNDISGLKNTIDGDYNTIHGTEFNVTGTHNVTFGVGGGCTINGKGNLLAGDLSSSTITGNYNTILCGGSQNTITGDNPLTGADKCQHNVILGSTTHIEKSENCLSLGRLNTINNHNRTTLMGIGLTATRDNQLIVGSYNDESKKGGAFVVANGNADNHSNAMTVYAEGTVTIGHDPIGDMDVVTKQFMISYVENAILNGAW